MKHKTVQISLDQGFPFFFQMAPFEEKKLWPPLTILLKLPLKTPKIFFFAFHHQLQNI